MKMFPHGEAERRFMSFASGIQPIPAGRKRVAKICNDRKVQEIVVAGETKVN
jgi:hypothetical protein